MTRPKSWRRFWWWLLAAIIVVGVLSRMTHTGFRLWDKYLGDALYAAMVYGMFRLTGRITRVALWSAIALLAIELFQLTGIAYAMSQSESLLVRIISRILGTHFSVFDLLAYAVGVAGVAMMDRKRSSTVNDSRS